MGIIASNPHGPWDVIPMVTKLITIHATTEITVTGVSDTACDFLSAFQCLLNVKRILLQKLNLDCRYVTGGIPYREKEIFSFSL